MRGAPSFYSLTQCSRLLALALDYAAHLNTRPVDITAFRSFCAKAQAIITFCAIVISTALLHPAIRAMQHVNSNYIVQHLAYCPISRAAFPNRRNCTPACMCILNNIAVEKPQGSHVPIHCARETRGKQQRTHAPWQLTHSLAHRTQHKAAIVWVCLRVMRCDLGA
jgi:hypothetical protein